MTEYKLEIKQNRRLPQMPHLPAIHTEPDRRPEHPYKRVLRSFSLCGALLLRELPHVLSALRRHQLHRASRSMDLPAAGAADVVPRENEPAAFAAA